MSILHIVISLVLAAFAVVSMWFIVKAIGSAIKGDDPLKFFSQRWIWWLYLGMFNFNALANIATLWNKYIK